MISPTKRRGNVKAYFHFASECESANVILKDILKFKLATGILQCTEVK